MLQHDQRGWVLVTDGYLYIMTRKNSRHGWRGQQSWRNSQLQEINLPGGIGSRCIKMLPDVGMVTYPECLWNMMLQNVHLGCWAWNSTPPCSSTLQNVHLGWWAWMVPLLVPGVFPPVGFFPCRHTCSSETRGTIPTSLLVFVGNVFTPLVSLLFLECKLHCGTCSLALKARAEAVLITIYTVYVLWCCVLSFLVCIAIIMSTWVVEHGMVATSPFVPEVFHQLIFPCRHMCSSETLAPPLHLYLFLWRTFLLSLFLYFLWSASCTLQFHSCFRNTQST